MNNSQQQPPSIRFAIVWIVIGFAFCNFITLCLAEGGVWPIACVFCGLMPAQGGLLAIWGALGPYQGLIRMSVTMLIGVFLMASFGVGMLLFYLPGPLPFEILGIPLFLPIYLLALQVPLWTFRMITGGRITRLGSHDDQSTAARRQFGLKDLMGGTVVLAVALSLASSGLLIFEVRGVEGWIPIVVTCFYGMVLSAFTTLPCLWAAMIAKNKDNATGLIAVYTLLMTLLLLVVLAALSRGSMPVEFASGAFAILVSLMVAILGTLHIVRLNGYTYVSPRRPLAVIENGCPFDVGNDSSEGEETAGAPIVEVDSPSVPAGPFD